MENSFCFGAGTATEYDMNGMSVFDVMRQTADLGQLTKAMEAGYPVPTYAGGGTGSPLLRQELVDQLFIQCESKKLVRFFPTVYKNSKPSNNTVVEYRKQTGVGDQFANIYQAEGAAGPVIDSTFTEHYTKMRWIAERRIISRQGEMIANSLAVNGSLKSQMMFDAGTHIGTRLEHGMFYGDSTVNANATDGLKRFITANNASWQVVDKRNAALTLSDVGLGQESVFDNVFGYVASTLWAPSRALQIFADEHGDRVKAVYTDGSSIPSAAGSHVKQVITQMTPVDVEYSYFLSPTRKLLVHSAATAATAPDAPTQSSITATGDAASKFEAADAATYTYKVVAVGNTTGSGASAPTTFTPTAVVAGDKVTLVIDATGSTNCQFYNIYRHAKGGTAYYLIGSVACAGGSATTTFVDYNEEIPGCADAFLIDPSAEVIQWREMMPYSMIQLPAIELTQPYAFAMFGTLINPIPAMIRFKNIKVF